jgi:hypothetical protein
MGLPNTKGLPNAAIVGALEIGGFTSREGQESVQGPAGLEIVGCDVVEVYPACDHDPPRRQRSARVSQPARALQGNGVDVNNTLDYLARGCRSGADGGYTGMS